MPDLDELFAENLHMYSAVIVRWIDADTVVLNIDQGFHDWKHDQRIRIVGIDAPDKQPAKMLARMWAEQKWPCGTRCYVKTYVDRQGDEKNSFERWLGSLLVGGQWYDELAIAGGAAVAWDGKGPHPS
jgi:endonuclease YncB( thermonuclease family)